MSKYNYKINIDCDGPSCKIRGMENDLYIASWENYIPEELFSRKVMELKNANEIKKTQIPQKIQTDDTHYIAIVVLTYPLVTIRSAPYSFIKLSQHPITLLHYCERANSLIIIYDYYLSHIITNINSEKYTCLYDMDETKWKALRNF
tara:strand:+ start:647 stop:1087 length:441 start_codon:yes stop_codon:yes gene_type:complete